MTNPNLIVIGIMTLFMGFLIIAAFIDTSKKRVPRKFPFISFIIPAYNAEKIVENAIENIFTSYDNNKLELIVINDGSKDNTHDVLIKLQKKHKFKLLNNKKNIGKAASLNKAFKYSRGKIIGFIDADTFVNKNVLDDMLSRLEDKNIGAAGASLIPKNNGILPLLQNLEFNMHALTFCSFNAYSSLGISGYCMFVKRELFENCGMFQENMIGEDTDLGLKINEKEWKVKNSYMQVYTFAPNKPIHWIKQKVRWGSTGGQNFIAHFNTIMKNPITYIFLIFYLSLTSVIVFSLLQNHLFIPEIVNFISNIGQESYNGIAYYTINNFGMNFKDKILIGILYSLFSLPYAIMSVKKPVHFFKIILIFPFALIYLPIFMFFSTIGFFYGIYKYFKLKNGGRAW